MKNAVALQLYKEWSPTSHDIKGLNSEGMARDNEDTNDYREWLVAPCGTNRDADACTRANWETQLASFKKADASGEDYNTCEFGHWACGWFSIVLVKPGSACARIALEFKEHLVEFGSVLDEDKLTEFEDEDAQETWKNCYQRREVSPRANRGPKESERNRLRLRPGIQPSFQEF